ncbi:hypothetical protein NQ176_g4607 [Zarea fungicola]|uniref:Uncharacterized protein n=1 Tax=Zarea fungicola TaxID=93591 RepID=A0ACC1NDS2_9HYPO|nr:hypothetical protein NQ176_g4607 [Lecanicillium fungicola]
MADTTDRSPLRRTACFTCTKAKRRCTKEEPGCRRCLARGLLCRYPPLKMMIELPVDLEAAFMGVPSTCSNSDGGGLNDRATGALPWPEEQRPLSLNFDYSSVALPPQHAWFLSPEHWQIDHRPSLHEQPSFRDEALRFFTQQLLAWLKQWVTEGHSPFIHSQLYQQDSPSHIQLAFTTCAAYFSKTEATTSFVMRILEEQSATLVEQSNALDPTILSTGQHVSRTQALLIYQIIRLFDGDIRSRAQAEDRLDVLLSWATQMWESARLSAAASLSSDPLGSQPNAFKLDGSTSALWRAWYLAESVRRTYVLSAFLQGVYLTMKQGWSYCPGGVAFSMGTGLWNATSASTWIAEHRDKHGPQLMESKEPETAFINARPADVDEFAKCILTVSRGLESVEEWIAQKGP